jgi:hypothetical protein
MGIIDVKTLMSCQRPGRLVGVVTVAVLAFAGCGPKGVKKVTVHGTVTYKGQPLRSGMLTFVGAEWNSGAPIRQDGTFTITDVIPGEVKVGVMETPQGSRAGSPDEPRSPPVSLPDKYRDPEKSGLRYTITPETTELPIEIRD